jgi:hypothetical protein
LVDGWPGELVPQDAGTFNYHFHDVEEWLEVQEGEIRFATLGGDQFRCVAGQALNIPLGEVHKVVIPKGGVVYRSWTSRQTRLDPESDALQSVITLLSTNLEIPLYENNVHSVMPEHKGQTGRKRLERIVSKKLLFRNARGDVVGCADYLSGLPGPLVREKSTTIRVLHLGENKRRVPTLLLATMVRAREDPEEPWRSFRNLRHFEKGPEGWRCCVWLNYEVATSS